MFFLDFSRFFLYQDVKLKSTDMRGADVAYEIESKYRVADAAALKKLADVFTGLSSHVLWWRSYLSLMHYYDTAGFDLYKAGVVVRLMEACSNFFPNKISVKTSGAVDSMGNLRREEYEARLPHPALDLSVLHNPRAQELLNLAKGRKLFEVFNTVSSRQDICLGFAINGKTVAIDLSLDDMTIVEAETKTVLRRIHEVEVELKTSLSTPGVTEAEMRAVLGHVRDQFRESSVPLTPVHEGRGTIGMRLVAG